MQITLQHHCEILFFFFLRKSKSSQGAQTGGTQVPLSETVQPNCTNQSFSQQCILLFLLFLFGCFCWVFFLFSLSQQCWDTADTHVSKAAVLGLTCQNPKLVPRWAAAETSLGEVSACFSLTLLRSVAVQSLGEYQCPCSRLERFSLGVLPHWKHLGNSWRWLAKKQREMG